MLITFEVKFFKKAPYPLMIREIREIIFYAGGAYLLSIAL